MVMLVHIHDQVISLLNALMIVGDRKHHKYTVLFIIFLLLCALHSDSF